MYKRHLQAAPYNYDDNTALEIVTRLTYIAAGNVGTWYSGSDTEGGCGSSSGYKEYLKADDDDASINNGTPHMQAIFDAFNNHGIACRDVSVTDSGCPNNPDSQPIVSVMSGNMAATLTWDSVPNASKYEVLRTEGVFQCGQGKVLLGEVSSNQARTWTDTGLQNGREYYYIVVPKGNDDSCYGPSSDCKAVVPAESPDFYLSCPSEPVVFDDMFLPSTDARECIVSAYGGWTGTTELTCSGFDGINCDIPASVTIANGENEANVLLTIGAAASASKGEGSISVTAVHESITRTSPIDVKILGGGGPQVAEYANGAPTW